MDAWIENGNLPEFLNNTIYMAQWNDILVIRDYYVDADPNSVRQAPYNAIQARQARLKLRGCSPIDSSKDLMHIMLDGKKTRVDIEGHYTLKAGHLLVTVKGRNPKFPHARAGYIINAEKEYEKEFKNYCTLGSTYTITMGHHFHLQGCASLNELEVNSVFKIRWGKYDRIYLLAAPRSSRSKRPFFLFSQTTLRTWPKWEAGDFECALKRAMWMCGIGDVQEMDYRPNAFFYGMRDIAIRSKKV
ncbi:hypothetical protein B0T14DRAFT_501972 [Immersiella caudata]|uniref:Uncharacterized protein n=1 Tax=Immersiella caudata TaxID=314043 RepID=A0AA39XCV4_9PEZI|nr:hypothetical protein B0T14DRAFT_501972 [Immersiella caudata]